MIRRIFDKQSSLWFGLTLGPVGAMTMHMSDGIAEGEKTGAGSV